MSRLCTASVGRGTSPPPQACLTTLSSLLTSLSHFVAVFSRLVKTTSFFVVRTSRGQTQSFKGFPPRPLCLPFPPLLFLCFIASFVLYGHFQLSFPPLAHSFFLFFFVFSSRKFENQAPTAWLVVFFGPAAFTRGPPIIPLVFPYLGLACCALSDSFLCPFLE